MDATKAARIRVFVLSTAYILLLVLFIVSMVVSKHNTTNLRKCPSALAIIETITIYTVYEDFKPTNESFAIIKYTINGGLYKNTTSISDLDAYKLEMIKKHNGVIHVYRKCKEVDTKYYLGATIFYQTDNWFPLAVVTGQLLFFSTLFVIGYVSIVCCAHMNG
jgi:hypothetical protein